MSTSSADRVEDAEGRQYHIGVAPGELAPWILLVGDPTRADRVAERFDEVRLSRTAREYVTHTGVHRGLEISVMGTGIGADNTEIAVQELLQCVRHPVLLRVGSSGALQTEIELGDIVVTTGAVRLESTSLGFVEPGYPAVAHHEVVLAAITAAKRCGHPAHAGLTATAAGFYGWQGRTDQIVPSRHPKLPEQLGEQGVLNMEMEASTLLTLASLAKVRAGCICAVFGNRPCNEFVSGESKVAAESNAIDVGFETLHVLAAMRAEAGEGDWVVPQS